MRMFFSNDDDYYPSVEYGIDHTISCLKNRGCVVNGVYSYDDGVEIDYDEPVDPYSYESFKKRYATA